MYFRFLVLVLYFNWLIQFRSAILVVGYPLRWPSAIFKAIKISLYHLFWLYRKFLRNHGQFTTFIDRLKFHKNSSSPIRRALLNKSKFGRRDQFLSLVRFLRTRLQRCWINRFFQHSSLVIWHHLRFTFTPTIDYAIQT